MSISSSNEKKFLNLIKFTPPLFIIVIFIVTTIFLYIDKQISLKKEQDYVKASFIRSNKLIIKRDIEQLHEFIRKTQKETELKLKENIKNRVYEAYNIALRIHNEYKNTKSKKEITEIIKNALVDIRFNDKRGYYYIYSMDYECILLPILRHLEGTSFYNYQDSKGTYLTREIIKDLQSKSEGYKNWWYLKPNDTKSYYKKIGFFKHFEPYDWFIGSGEYFLEFEESIKKQVIDYVSKLSNNENSHYFILNYDREILYHQIDEMIGQKNNTINLFQDEEKVVDDIISIAKSGNAYLSYIPKNSTYKEIGATKTIYVEGIQNWGWAIGKIFHQNEIEKLFKEKEEKLNKKFNENILSLFSISLILMLILLIISKYFIKLIENQFKKYKDDINIFIEERTKNHHIISQQSKMAAMGEMLGNIAHQWRQPLSVISTISSGIKIQKDLGDLDDNTLNKSLDNITETSKYLSKTIDDFRNFYKSDKYPSDFSVKEVIEQALKLTEASFKNHDITTITEIDDFKIFGLKNEFLQALINIFNNSKDELETIESNRYLFVRTYLSNTKKIVEIKDNAGGVNEDILEKICNPYFTTKSSSKGTGIGLYMTNEIINQHMDGQLTMKNIKYSYEKEEYEGLLTIIEFDVINDK